LKVVKRWGVISGNVAWVFFCRRCGHHGRRAGTRLVKGDTRCPACRFQFNDSHELDWLFKGPDPERVESVMKESPKPNLTVPGEGKVRRVRAGRALEKWSYDDLIRTRDMILKEIERRREAAVKGER
jgi:hypothetical protein